MFRVWNKETQEMVYPTNLYWFKENNIPRLYKNGCYYDYIIMPFTGQLDRHSREIYVGDIIKYRINDDFDVKSVVRFGTYRQDGSNGMYFPTYCLGIYVEVIDYRCTADRDYPVKFEKYYETQNLLEVAYHCTVVGNIYEDEVFS